MHAREREKTVFTWSVERGARSEEAEWTNPVAATCGRLRRVRAGGKRFCTEQFHGRQPTGKGAYECIALFSPPSGVAVAR